MDQRIPISPPVIEPVLNEILRPVWSVMIPVYNCMPYIKETLESVLLQDMGAELMQIEVIDDCSTDGNVEELVQDIGKGRVQYYRQKVNRGSLRNFETCINRAKGYYVHLLHGDDRVEPGYYKKIAELFKSHPDAGAAFTNFSYIDHLSRKVNIINPSIQKRSGIIPGFLYKIAEKQLLQPPAIVVKRSVYEDIGSFFAVHFGEDWEMWVRIASKYPVAYSPEYLASYRVAHGIGISHNYFLTGQNITDMGKVINIVQSYLPAAKRLFYKKEASAYYAIFSIRIANGLLLHNKEAAFRQIKGAWGLSQGLNTALWIIRFYLMYLFRYKQLENGLKKGRKSMKKRNFQFLFEPKNI